MLQTDIFEIITIFLPLILVISLTIIIWIVGRSMNKRMFLAINSEIEKVIIGHITNELEVEGDSPSTKVMVGAPLLRDLKTFKTLVSLEERHLLVTFIFSLFGKPQDFVLFESNLPQRPPVAIEVMPWKEKRLMEKNSKYLNNLELLLFNNEKFDSALMVRANRRGPALEILGEKTLFRTLYQLRDYLYWISVDFKEEPHLKVMIRWQKNANMAKMKEVFLILAQRINASEYDKKKKTYGGKKKKE